MRALIVVALLAGCPRTGPSEPAAPQHAAALSLIEASPDLDGHLIGPSDAHATIVVLMASWCAHCRAELALLGTLRETHPRMRIVGVNYKPHEEYDNRGNAAQLRAYLAAHVPWLRVAPIGDPIYRELGRPPFVPAVWVYDARGELVQFFDRRVRPPPARDELEALLARLGA
jgi:thiol-disulfide isomerase/thioredoxin